MYIILELMEGEGEGKGRGMKEESEEIRGKGGHPKISALSNM